MFLILIHFYVKKYRVSVYLLYINEIFGSFKTINYSFLYYPLVRSNKEKKTCFTVPCVYDIYALIYSIFTLCAMPLFYFNTYILTLLHNNSICDNYVTLSVVLKASFITCTSFYLLLVIVLNIYYKNSNNTWIIVKKLVECYDSVKARYFCNYTIIFKIQIIIFTCLSLLIFLVINMLVLNMFIGYLDLRTDSLLLYIYTSEFVTRCNLRKQPFND